MDFVRDIKEACDSIEERIYALNNILREKTSDEKVVLELNNILITLKKIKASVNEENAYNTRGELLSIQKDIDILFENAARQK